MRRVLVIAAAMLLLAGCVARPAQPNETAVKTTVEPISDVYNADGVYWDESATDCGHEVKPVVSMELVSQEKPLVFFELMEYPKVEGIKVKLTYEDSSSEVVDAYDLKQCVYSSAWSCGDAGMEHNRGMFIFYPEAFTLAPGRQQIAMFYVDHKSSWSTDHGVGFIRGHFNSLHPENGYVDCYNRSDSPPLDAAYCMVEVYAQTGDEYIAEHNRPFALVTEYDGGEVVIQDGYGIVKLLVQESGTYKLEAVSGSFYGKYFGSGVFKCVTEILPDGTIDCANTTYYARLNANKPLFITAASSKYVSMKRVPDGTVVFDE